MPAYLYMTGKEEKLTKQLSLIENRITTHETTLLETELLQVRNKLSLQKNEIDQSMEVSKSVYTIYEFLFENNHQMIVESLTINEEEISAQLTFKEDIALQQYIDKLRNAENVPPWNYNYLEATKDHKRIQMLWTVVAREVKE
jgi:hypothetical protein